MSEFHFVVCLAYCVDMAYLPEKICIGFPSFTKRSFSIVKLLSAHVLLTRVTRRIRVTTKIEALHVDVVQAIMLPSAAHIAVVLLSRLFGASHGTYEPRRCIVIDPVVKLDADHVRAGGSSRMRSSPPIRETKLGLHREIAIAVVLAQLLFQKQGNCIYRHPQIKMSSVKQLHK